MQMPMLFEKDSFTVPTAGPAAHTRQRHALAMLDPGHARPCACALQYARACSRMLVMQTEQGGACAAGRLLDPARLDSCDPSCVAAQRSPTAPTLLLRGRRPGPATAAHAAAAGSQRRRPAAARRPARAHTKRGIVGPHALHMARARWAEGQAGAWHACQADHGRSPLPYAGHGRCYPWPSNCQASPGRQLPGGRRAHPAAGAGCRRA